MKASKKALATILAITGIVVSGYIIINTSLFKPSIGSRIARLIVSFYIAPAIADRNSPVPARNTLERISMLTILPIGTSIEEINIGSMKADRISAPGVDPKGRKILLYLHGGGFSFGSRNVYRDLTVRISAASGMPVLLPEYRLAPEHKFPAANEDCLAAYNWLLSAGYAPGDIAIGGDSAGGCLTLMTMISLRDAGKPMPGAAILLSTLADAIYSDGETIKTKAGIDPFFLKPEEMDAHMDRYIGEQNKKSPLLSPVRAELTHLPPMLIHVGSDEVLLSDSTRLAERAKKAGVDVTLKVWKHMFHVFQSFAIIVPEARESIQEIGDFLKKKLAI